MKRYKKEYSKRIATNSKRSRAALSPESIEAFKNPEKTLEDVPDSNDFNSDESNLSDDPGRR